MPQLVQNIDYRILGYHKKEIFDTKGDLATVEFYKNYDPGTDTFSNLRVKETRTYTRDAVTGLLTQRDMTIEWYGGGEILMTTKTTTKFYNAQKGYVANKQARQNLIDKAAMYLVSQVGVPNSKAFWKTVRNEADDYVNASEVTALINAINASTEPYITQPIKDTLVAMLNVSYI